MSVVTELSVPGSELAFGKVLSDGPEVTITLDRIVPVAETTFPYVWVRTQDYAAFKDALRTADVVSAVRLVQREDGRRLYRIEWRSDTGAFLDCLKDTGVVVLGARGTANRWDFELRFDTREDVRRFQQRCSEQGVSFSINRVVSGSAGQCPEETLSQRQRETLELALKRGYFDVPRRTTMVKLAEELGISDQAVSARIRRGMQKLSRRELSEPLELPESNSRITGT
ncbi:MAG: helix-turn-helix domain-containing protein [Halapricum sp.]